MMRGSWLIAVMALMAVPGTSSADESTDTSLFRVFLNDGSSLVSYGELARVNDRVVFSMPTSASHDDPQLHLINIPASRVDWTRTTRYAESARAARYIATRAESDYAILTNDIARALNDVARMSNPADRLPIVERARRRLADWPRDHYNYNQVEVRQMLAMLDEAIADLRAQAGVEQFALSFVASTDLEVVREPLLPAPTAREVIEQTARAARLTDIPVDRVSLYTTVLVALDRDRPSLPEGWAASTRAVANRAIADELALDRTYRALTDRYLQRATMRARGADVRGVERLITELRAEDQELGSRRSEMVDSLLSSIDAQLDAARRLRLARDRWALRAPEFRAYHASVSLPIDRLLSIQSMLEDIKSLAGSTPAALLAIQQASAQVLRAISPLVPPVECRPAHALLVSAAQLAGNAARIRREAALTADISRAWDASSAAAGALMLHAKARLEIQGLLRLPELPR